MFANAIEATGVLDLNVGGIKYSVSRKTLLKESRSRFTEWFTIDGKDNSGLCKDNDGYYFIDRDGQLFRYILDYLRNDKILLPDDFDERQRLSCEAKYFNLEGLTQDLASNKSLQKPDKENRKYTVATAPRSSGHITIGYQGSLSFGKQGLATDINFRKINRILVCGKVSLCREVFGSDLNEGRDPDRGHQNDRDRYTSRYYLKHSFIEYAFDTLSKAGFQLVASCASSTSGFICDPKSGSNTEEDRWAHYNEYVFYRQA